MLRGWIIGVFCCVLAACVWSKEMKYNVLTPQEERVIVHRGTEPPFSGVYNDHWAKGTYVCKRCGAKLYRSQDKFSAGCGWPSFDDEIEGAVKHAPDPDGQRTEILCTACGAHLGHVFAGEGFTPKNERHCVNSLSLNFVPAAEGAPAAQPGGIGKAIFALGCFWGAEYQFQRAKGVIETRVGYCGGTSEAPTYRDVCSGRTGHAEAVEVTYDPAQTIYEELARLFFEIHDPEQVNRQGPDIGAQYRSVIFYSSDEQKTVAEKSIAELNAKGYRVATQVQPVETFWPAEAYHQNYYEKNGGVPYCHVRTKRF